jgi:hypothetical protein
VQVPCIERCAYGAVKAWTGYCIASEETAEQRRVDLDTTIGAMVLTAKEMNAKYKEISEGGLAVSVVRCLAATKEKGNCLEQRDTTGWCTNRNGPCCSPERQYSYGRVGDGGVLLLLSIFATLFPLCHDAAALAGVWA